MKTPSHPIINLVLNGMAFAVLGLLVLGAANLAVTLWIRVRHELRSRQTARSYAGQGNHHAQAHAHHKPHEKEDGL